MSIAFQGASAAVSSSLASSSTITWPGSPSGQLLLAVFGLENVNVGSGPWVSGTPGFGGHARVFYQEPSANGGNGLEVWVANGWSTGAFTTYTFTGSYAYVGQGYTYTGQKTGSGVVRAYASQAWTGNNPEAPAVYTFANEMLIVAAADQLQSPGYGTPTPSGWTKRDDQKRGGTYGNVEITAADKLTTVEGDTGAIPWSATASTGTTKGATATLAIRPAAALVEATSPLIAIEYPAR